MTGPSLMNELTHEVPKDLKKIFYIWWSVFNNINIMNNGYTKSLISRDRWDTVCVFAILVVSADGSVTLDARASAATVMTKLGSCIYAGLAFEELTHYPMHCFEIVF